MQHMKGFEKEFKCNPLKPCYGFKSWDDFFTREFREGVCPVASPDDKDIAGFFRFKEDSPMIQDIFKMRINFVV